MDINMSRFSSACAALVLFSSGFVSADNYYRSEIKMDYSRYTATYLDNFTEKTQAGTLSGAYFFEAVGTQSKPLAEADFLGKNSYVSAAYSTYKNKINADSFDLVDTHGSTQMVSTMIYVPSTILVVGAKYYESDPQNYHSIVYTLGLTPLEGLLVYTTYWDDDNYGHKTNINAKYVMPMADSTAVSMQFGFFKGDGEQGNIYSVSGDYYFNPRYSLGLSAYEDDGLTYGINSRYFFNETLSIFGGASRASPNDLGVEMKNITLGASVRF
jgi:hypothetical protein